MNVDRIRAELSFEAFCALCQATPGFTFEAAFSVPVIRDFALLLVARQLVGRRVAARVSRRQAVAQVAQYLDVKPAKLESMLARAERASRAFAREFILKANTEKLGVDWIP